MFLKSFDFALKSWKFKILKKPLAKSGCHGNIKLTRQGLAIPNCSLLRRRLCGWLLYLFSSQILNWSSCGIIFFTERGLGRREGKNEGGGRDACLNPSLVDF